MGTADGFDSAAGTYVESLSEKVQPKQRPVDDTDSIFVREGIDSTKHDETNGWVQFLKYGWFGHAGSKGDAWLTSSAAQIGQVMLSLPRAVYLTGAAAGLPLMLVVGTISTYTIYVANTLYIEAKRRKMAAGNWFEPGTKRRTRALQYYEVIGYLTNRWVGVIVLVTTIIGLLSTGIAQIIACSADSYYIDDSTSKRTWALAWGAILSTVFILVPTFKHLKILALVGIIGTFLTSVYIWVVSGHDGVSGGSWTTGPTSLKEFFLGFNVFLSALGGHGMSFEIMDSMWKPSKYAKVYPFSTLFTFIVTVPHSVLAVLAYGAANFKNDNVFGVLPKSGWRTATIVLMLLHQCVAYVIYVGPVFFMSEKLFHVHSSAYWKRILARIPVAAFVWLIGIMLPFYGVINAFMGAFSGTLSAFVFPCATHLWVYRSSKARNQSLRQPPKWLFDRSWLPIILLNLVVLIIFAISGLGFGMWSAVSNFIDKIHSLGVFTDCYQCATHVATAAPVHSVG